MIDPNPSSSRLWPLGAPLNLLGGGEGVITVAPGMTTLVGPSGSGKTRALRAVKTALSMTNRIAQFNNRKVRFLAAGRASPFEIFRSAVTSPSGITNSDAAVGHQDYRTRWFDIESLTGDLLALDSRADLRLKVEARLQQLFDRSLRLSWSQQGLSVSMTPMLGGSSYAANHEASGILQLVGLLAAIHNDEIGALIIDEPEISLHPQHQAFLLEEMESVAGDPADPARKLIVLATHSPNLLALRTTAELPKLVFFNDIKTPPIQIASDNDILKNGKLSGLISRLSATHRTAMFAEQVLLVEGPSDEIIAAGLARRLGLRLLARNAQILPVTGKGEFPAIAKAFRLMNKTITILADLDALADDNQLVNFISGLPQAAHAASVRGQKSLVDFDRQLRSALNDFIVQHTDAVEHAASSYPTWFSDADPAKALKRLTLARLLTDPKSFDGEVAGKACALAARFDVLLDLLCELKCFILRRGAIENYQTGTDLPVSKPEMAAAEAASFDCVEALTLEARYPEVLSALRSVAPRQSVDEDIVLRPKLSALLGASFQAMTRDTSTEELQAAARATIGADADIFRLENLSTNELRLRVTITSPIFEREGFPFEISEHENANLVVRSKLPGL